MNCRSRIALVASLVVVLLLHWRWTPTDSSALQRQVSFVLPVGTRNADRDRIKLLLVSLAKFFDMGSLHTMFLFTPDKHIAATHAMLQEHAGAFDSDHRAKLAVLLTKIQVVGDSQLVPEFGDGPKGLKTHVPGYTKQQILKLAAAQIVKTDWYLTLDADVINVQPTGFKDLIRANPASGAVLGRAITTMTSVARHRDWFAWADKVLNTAIHSTQEPVLGVTPCLMHTHTVRKLHAHIEELYPRGSRSWRAVLAGDFPNFVGEYALYFTYMWKFKLFDKLYDAHSKESVYLSHGYSAWSLQEFKQFNASKAFQPHAPGYFIVIQSRMDVDAKVVWEQVSPFLAPDTPGRLR